MKIAVIGAGVAGIISLKYALEAGHEVDCFEETEQFGGTWVYTNKTGEDDNGLKIYRNMYKNLITNLPKEVMQFSDFPYPEYIKASFLTQSQVLEYLTSFVDKFKLENHINYHESVIKVQPKLNNKWTVVTTNVVSKIQQFRNYDSVFVCNGHFRYPKIPTISGQDFFKGLQTHSSDYRSSNFYNNKRVLIIGASYSGNDIVDQIKDITEKTFLSHWAPLNKVENVVVKPKVSEFKPQGAIFTDGTEEEFNIVIYCTGYEYKFPFLDESSGITVEDNCIQPLYKHVINIEHPTMFFIGIPFLVPAFWTCDIQARFSFAALADKFHLPTKHNMLKDLDDYLNKLKTNNVPKRHTHKIGIEVAQYFANLANIASIKPIPPVISKIYIHKINQVGKETKTYIIVDEENFIIS